MFYTKNFFGQILDSRFHMFYTINFFGLFFIGNIYSIFLFSVLFVRINWKHQYGSRQEFESYVNPQRCTTYKEPIGLMAIYAYVEDQFDCLINGMVSCGSYDDKEGQACAV